MRSRGLVSAFNCKILFTPPLYDAVIELEFPMKYTCSKKRIFQSRDLCLRSLDTNSLCAKDVRRNGEEWKKRKEKNFGRLCMRS